MFVVLRFCKQMPVSQTPPDVVRCHLYIRRNIQGINHPCHGSILRSEGKIDVAKRISTQRSPHKDIVETQQSFHLFIVAWSVIDFHHYLYCSWVWPIVIIATRTCHVLSSKIDRKVFTVLGVQHKCKITKIVATHTGKFIILLLLYNFGFFVLFIMLIF